jgi:hypothetical protein
VAGQLARVIAAIAPLELRQNEQRRQNERRGEGGDLSRFERLRAALGELRQRLEEDDTAAADLIDALVADVLAPDQLTLLRELEAAVGRYDFDAAKDYLQRLAALLAVDS